MGNRICHDAFTVQEQYNCTDTISNVQTLLGVDLINKVGFYKKKKKSLALLLDILRTDWCSVHRFKAIKA